MDFGILLFGCVNNAIVDACEISLKHNPKLTIFLRIELVQVVLRQSMYGLNL